MRVRKFLLPALLLLGSLSSAMWEKRLSSSIRMARVRADRTKITMTVLLQSPDADVLG